MHSVNYLAYLDAGTGSLIIQSLVGVVAGVAVFGRRMVSSTLHKVTSVFKRSNKTQDK
jgi:hypothetical protein